MESRTKFSVVKLFIRNVLALEMGMLVVAGLITWLLDVNFGMILLIAGIIIGGIGAFLSAPDPTAPDNPRNLSFKYINRPNKRLQDQEIYNIDHSTPRFALENVMLYAGLVAIILSIPFLILLIFSK